jgi:3-methyladenine DNA glycosylase AlkD
MTALRRIADAGDAIFLQRFFKTGPGEYGEGDRFLGIRVPRTRRLAAIFESLPQAEILRLLAEPWHEARLLGLLILVRRFERGPLPERARIYRLYLRHTDRINNWDLVDVTAPRIVGAYRWNRSPAPFFALAKSPRLWDRRIAVVATAHFIRRGRFDVTLELARLLRTDPHDLMHKACGWMLREVGKRDESVLESFLDRHAARMPRTMLRYAIERLPPARRAHWRAVRPPDCACVPRARTARVPP